MILYLICLFFIGLLSLLINLVPVLALPATMTTAVASAIALVVKFNYYLPISDVFTVFGLLISFGLSWKIIAIILNKFGIDLSK